MKSSPVLLFQNNKCSAFFPYVRPTIDKGITDQTINTKADELYQTDLSQALSEVHSEKLDIKEETPKEFCLDCDNVNSADYKELHSYKGNSKFHTAGANSSRKDVVFKTLIRSIRRYLCLGDSENLKFFKEFVLEFYDKNIKCNSETALKLSSDDEDDVCYFLGTMITKDYTFPDIQSNRNNERIRIHKIFNEIAKSFSVFKFNKFLTSVMIKNTMKILKESGIIDKIINLYKPLAVLKERYELAVEMLSNPTEENIKFFEK